MASGVAALVPALSLCYAGSDFPMTTIQLPHTDAKLVYLALQLHLERPGSELDAESGGPRQDGLTHVEEELKPQLRMAVASVDVTAAQQERLSAALAGAINQLKSLPLLVAGGQRPPPRFDAVLRELFPEVAEDPENAMSLAGEMLQLRRRIDNVAATSAPAASPTTRPWWRFWGDD